MKTLKGLEKRIRQRVSRRIVRTLGLERRLRDMDAELRRRDQYLKCLFMAQFSQAKELADVMPYVTRDQFGILFDFLSYKHRGAEIGVQAGIFSDRILRNWQVGQLISIDPWRHWQDGYDDDANVHQEAQDALFRETCERLSEHGDRSKVLRMTSLEGAETVGDAELDFAYLDAQHHYEAIQQDISIWWPKIRPGGCLCGHDYDPVAWPGVVQATTEFAAAERLPLMTTPDGSWLVIRPATD